MNIQQRRRLDPEDLTAHDICALIVLAGLAANSSMTNDEIVVPKLVSFSRGVADEFLKQREEQA